MQAPGFKERGQSLPRACRGDGHATGRHTRSSGKALWVVLVGLLLAAAVAAAIMAVVRLDTTGRTGSGLSSESSYDISALRKVSPELILYAETSKPIPVDMTAPKALALGPEGAIYVAGDQSVAVFDGQGSPLRSVQLEAAPQCLAVMPGKFYVGMKDHVEVYDDEGKRLSAWASPGSGAVLTAIAVGAADVFVADAGRRVVHRYDQSGKVIGRIGARNPDRNIPGFVIPSPHFDLAIAPDGLLRVVNPGRHQIEAYTFDGDLEFAWGKFTNAIDGFCGCCNPVHFAIMPDGGFVTAEKGLARVKVHDHEGKFVGVVAGPEQLSPPEAGGGAMSADGPVLDVAVGQDGRVLVLDPYTKTVRTFTRTKKG
jgi:hypothetical protein